MNAFRTVVLAALLLPTTLRAVAAGPLDRVRDSFVRVSALSYAPDEEITDRFIRYSDYGRANDVLLLQLYTCRSICRMPRSGVCSDFSMRAVSGATSTTPTGRGVGGSRRFT